ncbi:UNVERIFIED_CONTAM: Cleavage and polyadenylation specificity factor subunit [Sesamum latifolium]|uniref:Cleavage and polyadenylation specificity factor subunit n=1 Tax=Sesamum latifolium TaxID=2727402 RepID=A0AAW2XKZ3_9LAMI
MITSGKKLRLASYYAIVPSSQNCPFNSGLGFAPNQIVQRLELSKSRASVLTSDITTVGNSLLFLGSRLGDSLLVQYNSGAGAPTLGPGVKEEVGDIESDAPLSKRLRMSSSDALQDLVTGEELSFYGTGPNNPQLAQVKMITYSMPSFIALHL